MEDIAKIICYGLLIIGILYIIAGLVPYLVFFLALCGAWHLLQEYKKQ